MTATQPKPQQSPTGKVYRAKVTGRHAITLPAELCRQLGIEIGDSVELEIKDGAVELRPSSPVEIVPVAELRGIMKGMFKDWEDIQRYVRGLRDEWDDHPELEDAPASSEAPLIVTQVDIALDRARRDGRPVALDSSALIAYFSDEEPIAPIVTDLLISDASIVLSAITLSESLVQMIRIHGRAAAEEISASLQASANIHLVPFGIQQLVEAAEIRSETRLKFPDAAIIATARVAGAIAIVGNDRAWQNKSLGIEYIHLDDIVREHQKEEES